MTLDQKTRVLKLARKRGRHGITQIDFDLPDVADGGKPIKRVAARIGELQDDGIRFTDGGRRGRCKVYILDEASLSPSVPAASEPAPLLPAQAPRCAIFDCDDDEVAA